MFEASEIIAAGIDNLEAVKSSKKTTSMAKKAENQCQKNVNIREFITIKATKK